MLNCPVCEYPHREEVSCCQRCSLYEKDADQIKTIISDNIIVKKYIFTLVEKLEKYRKANNQSSFKKIEENYKKIYRQVQEITIEQKQNKQEIETLNKKIIELQSKIQSTSKHSNQDLDTQLQASESTEDTLTDPNNRDYSNIEDNERDNTVIAQNALQEDNNHSDLTASQESDLCNQIDQSECSHTINAQTPHFVEKYNIDKSLSDELVISAVIETQESVENRLAVVSKAIFLSNTNKGKYWIVEENNQYFLVPYPKININEHNKYTIKNLFECNDSSSGDYNFQLIQPAKVSKIDSGLWKLEQKGKLEFS